MQETIRLDTQESFYTLANCIRFKLINFSKNVFDELQLHVDFAFGSILDIQTEVLWIPLSLTSLKISMKCSLQGIYTPLQKFCHTSTLAYFLWSHFL